MVPIALPRLATTARRRSLIAAAVLTSLALGVFLSDRASGSAVEWAQIGDDIVGDEAGYTGWAVALAADGNRVAVGTPWTRSGPTIGFTSVYDWGGANWAQAGTDIDGEQVDDRSGWSVALSADGDRIAIGAERGALSVFGWNATGWTPVGDSFHGSTNSVAISADGNRVAAGSPSDGSAGLVRVYDWNGANWIQTGPDIVGEADFDDSGFSVALSADGNRVAIGAPYNDGTVSGGSGPDGSAVGHVRVYDWNSTNWVQVGADIDGEQVDDRSGNSVALSADGDRLTIGTPYGDGAAGRVRVYDWIDANWVQAGADIVGEAAGDLSGWSVAMSADGTRIAMVAPLNDATGHARVYDWTGTTWVQVGADIDGEGGWSVALSGDGTRVAIGAPYVKRVRVYAASSPTTTTSVAPTTTTSPADGAELPATGADSSTALLAAAAVAGGLGLTALSRRKKA